MFISMQIPEINVRIKKLIEYFSNGSENNFANTIGVSQGTINRLFREDVRYDKVPEATDNTIEKILNNLNVNKEWLKTGNGEMLVKQNTDSSIQSQTTENSKSPEFKNKELGYPKQYQVRSSRMKPQKYFPDVIVSNSDISLYDEINSGELEIIEMYDPNLEGAEIVLENFGDSNYPKVNSGDRVGYRRLNIKSYDSLNLDLLYMIITVNGQRMNKKLQYNKDNPEKLWCISINKEYKPFPILKSDILELWEVVGVSRRFN